MVGKRTVKGCTDKVNRVSVAKNLFLQKTPDRLYFKDSGKSLILDPSVLVKVATGPFNKSLGPFHIQGGSQLNRPSSINWQGTNGVIWQAGDDMGMAVRDCLKSRCTNGLTDGEIAYPFDICFEDSDDLLD